MLQDRAVLRMQGADTMAFLQGLLSNDVALLAASTPLYAGLLSPQGKLLFAVLLFAGDDGAVLIDVAADEAEGLLKRLSMYKLRKAVDIAPAPELAVFASIGTMVPGHTADPRTPALGGRWIAATDTIDTAADSADSQAAWHSHRLQLGIAEAAELGSDELLWLETGADLLNGVSFTKGCYVGQENTARMHHRDKVRRRIVPVQLAGTVDDTTLRDDAGRVVGSLRGTAAGNLALAHLRIEAVDAPILLGPTPVTVLRPDWLQPAFAGAA
ncbi:glycine cleavage system protein T [Polymorphobacter multimanifer]|nr:glycine cleavage system protein T [Polymorphobacter multimanifer]